MGLLVLFRDMTGSDAFFRDASLILLLIILVGLVLSFV